MGPDRRSIRPHRARSSPAAYPRYSYRSASATATRDAARAGR
jgi:hypothetical protein